MLTKALSTGEDTGERGKGKRARGKGNDERFFESEQNSEHPSSFLSFQEDLGILYSSCDSRLARKILHRRAEMEICSLASGDDAEDGAQAVAPAEATGPEGSHPSLFSNL